MAGCLAEQIGESEIAQFVSDIGGPLDCSLGSSGIYGIFQAKLLEQDTCLLRASRRERVKGGEVGEQGRAGHRETSSVETHQHWSWTYPSTLGTAWWFLVGA